VNEIWNHVDRAPLRSSYDEWIERIAATHGGANHVINEQTWFQQLTKPLADSKLALVTTAGAHLDDQEAFHVETTAGDASFRLIPDDVRLDRIRFTHTHYDTSSANEDPNVVLPLDALHAAVATGQVGSASAVHVGMMGFNPDPGEVAARSGPAIAALLGDHEVDVAVLVPG